MLTRTLSTHLGVLARAVLLVGIVTAWTLMGKAPDVAMVNAQQLGQDTSAGGSVAGAMKMAASGFGPVPTNTVLPPAALERIADKIRRERWQLPDEETTWPVEQGRPIVEAALPDELWHTVEPGQNLRRLRHMYRKSHARLRELNPHVDFSNLEPGQRILIWQRDGDKFSQSYGAPNWGRLYRGVPMPDDENWVILHRHRTFGTYYTISETKRVLDNYFEKYPEAHKLMVGDISFRNGRSIHPHKSHRTGRDIDVSYPRLEPPPNFRRFHHVRRDNLDVKKTLSLLKDLIDGGYVEYIFVDRWFQRLLREEALAQGATEEWVDAVFQYPHWSGGDAIIRHASGHTNHFHARFKCQPTDRRCR
jgi:hypothetical protein